ncbi:MAG: D-alanine--D-alanine ligase [Algiphilus sp.]|uniref:D-alanine--D-alanine ligase n=1 Tax=Algiphilus sp. TaxID=1872431 RepID=UPI0025C66FE5|nr:D-alanine--D-alanine ligase [Algiphilus sp.]MCI5061867.1 D-alanine--D-alanine ligase [Algiphilus sp.]MCI5103854.1 D-alanine--D-alanine ligase [Algiphilus sp.]
MIQPPRMHQPRAFGKVAVLCGGWSPEREISLQSGSNVFAALERQGVDATLLDVDRAMLLGPALDGFDRVLNLVHGRGGEDGLLQAVLELRGLPYPGAGVAASALAMDKLRSKRVWRDAGLPTPAFAAPDSLEAAHAAAAQIGYPLFIKPVADGSSVGIHKVRSSAQLEAAFLDAAQYGDVLMEAFAEGREFTCAVLDGTPLPLICIEPAGEFYDYHAKYLSDETRYLCPAPVDDALRDRLQAMALEAFAAIGVRQWGRVDFMLDGRGAPQLLEINTLPGMTTHSLVPMAAQAIGIDFDALCWRLLECTMEAA